MKVDHNVVRLLEEESQRINSPAFINLEKPRTNIDSGLIDRVQKDAVEKHLLEEQLQEKQGQLQKEEQKTLSQKQMTAIVKSERDSLASEMEEMKDIWTLGLTAEEYERFKQKRDEITAYIDSQPPEP